MANEDIRMRRLFEKTGEWDSEVDKHNTKFMKKIVAKYGWPTISLVGKKASMSAWLLVQHADSDTDFQSLCLDLMKKTTQVISSDVDKNHIAYLTDRVNVNSGRKQLFGTQFYVRNGEMIPRPIRDVKNLDKRRADLNLESFDDYTRRMRCLNERYQKNIVGYSKKGKGRINAPNSKLNP